MARWGQCGGTGAGACPSDLAGLAAIVGDLLEVAVRGIHARVVGVRFALLAVWLSLLPGRPPRWCAVDGLHRFCCPPTVVAVKEAADVCLQSLFPP